VGNKPKTGKLSHLISKRELDFYDIISFQAEDASYPFTSSPLTIFKNIEFGRTYWRPWSANRGLAHYISILQDERLTSDVLWNYDNVQILFTVGRLFSDLCSTPSDHIYLWKHGVLQRKRIAKDGRPVKKNLTLEEGIGLHFPMSQVLGELSTIPRQTLDPTRGFTVTLYPNFLFATD